MSINPDYIAPDGETFTHDEMEDRYEEWLDEICDEVRIGAMTYAPGRVLREVDPIAFRVGTSEWIDGEVQDGALDEWREDHPWIEGEDSGD